MSDLKSKMPDLNEIGSIAGKFFNDMKKSVVEIIDDYKKKHPSEVVEEVKAEAKPKAAKKATKEDTK